MAIEYNDVKIKINITELVGIRASFLGEEMTEEEIDELATDLKHSLTWDTLYGMVDTAILDYYDKLETHYGETAGDEPAKTYEKNRQQFKMVKLESPSWTIEVPIRK